MADDNASPLVRLSRATDRRRIGLIPVRGVIGGSVKVSQLVKTLSDAKRNDRIKAVVLDIDSPGGAATGSEAVHLAVRRLAAVKPVVAWISGTGASGAYFIACGATRILSFPSAIVGSIGVISIRPVAVEALRRLGTSVNVTKTGPFKDLGAPWREPSEEDQRKERNLIEAVFERFREAVKTARDLDDQAVTRVTTGEVWLGTQALELRLVDGLADDEEAVLEEAQELAALPHRKLIRLSPRKTLLQRVGVPGAGMGPPGRAWIVEVEGWWRSTRLMW